MRDPNTPPPPTHTHTYEKLCSPYESDHQLPVFCVFLRIPERQGRKRRHRGAPERFDEHVNLFLLQKQPFAVRVLVHEGLDPVKWMVITLKN